MNDFLQYVYPEKRSKEGIDIYHEETGSGLLIPAAPPSIEHIQQLDKDYEIDWVVPVQDRYVKHIEIGNYVICETTDEWSKSMQVCEQNVFLYTGNAWIWLIDRNVYTIETDKRRQVWIGELCTFQDVLENTCAQSTFTEEGLRILLEKEESIDSLRIAKARCEASMYKLDDIHRNYVNTHTFGKGDVVAIQSVAGSGKTTTLLNLAKIHKTKKILYIAFNKSLITEIKQKVYSQKITNMYPMTFDSLLYQMFSSVKKEDPTIITLKPQNIAEFVPWLKGKPYRLKSSIIRQYNQFCSDPRYTDIETFCSNEFGRRKPILEQIWAKTQEGSFHTFENMRKLAQTEHWFNPYIDKTYDMIMVDETQDFDMNMLRMLLDDTTIPKLFVGDPKQSIYEFRGCINAFLYMPEEALKIEFYSTFRVGNPACEIIRKQFSNCWMVSKSKHETILEPYSKWLGESYTYIFRSWKCLLNTAFTMKKIWINSYEKKCDEIRNLHKKLAFTFSLDDEFEDDLPKFLKSITTNELDDLLETIESNIVEKDEALVKMYTVHSYKGLEDPVVRLADDIERTEETIYYVALTRGFTRILTPMDVEYFEKLMKVSETNEREPKFVKEPVCACGGCVNKDHSICIFDTISGKKSWCIDCSKSPCDCSNYKIVITF